MVGTMFEHKTLHNLEDYFLKLTQRQEKGIYFYRINGYNEKIKDFIVRYYEAARTMGVVLEGKIPNPNEQNLAYYEEIMGMNFQFEQNFFLASLKKWLPRMNDYQRNNVAMSIYHTLDIMRREGKNNDILRNAYIKFMCWLYYKFERVVNQLGENQIPKILYEGTISNYELKLIAVLASCGCDVVLLQYQGDAGYLKLDPDSKLSRKFEMPGLGEFPNSFSISALRKEKEEQVKNQRLYGVLPEVQNCTNAWIEGKGLTDILKSTSSRGVDSRFFYNCFCRIEGVEDKLTYLNELYQFQLELKNTKRNIVILDKEIPRPSMEEINAIKREPYKDLNQMIVGLSSNLNYTANIELKKIMRKAFVDILLEESKKPENNLNKLTNRGIYLLCWLKRYQSQLFQNWKMPDIGCFILMGGCKQENEALFLRFLARLPVDILILVPNLNSKCCLQDKNLYEIHYTDSLAVEQFPRENSNVRMGTAAYHAERELDTLMYQDSGMYRNQQYQKANSVILQTTYEEIAILWKEELNYRSNFSVVDNVVNIPVIFAKVCGVKDGRVSDYWAEIKKLITQDTFVIKNAPFISSAERNPIKGYAVGFWKNGRLQREKIKAHSCYTYQFLREEMQNHMLDKLQMLIDQKLICGTFENGTEYTIIATVLNLKKEILRLIQKFDFTKKNPKLVFVLTTENLISLEDSIIAAFLSLIGFDIVFFVPTGYQCIEKFFQKRMIEEYQIGEYIYDLTIPDFNKLQDNTHRSWRDKIFKRG